MDLIATESGLEGDRIEDLDSPCEGLVYRAALGDLGKPGPLGIGIGLAGEHMTRC